MFPRQKQPFANSGFTEASMALENACLYSWERKRTQQLKGMNTIAQQMTVVLEVPELLAKVCLLNGPFRLATSPLCAMAGHPWWQTTEETFLDGGTLD
jgi:hypothetical protein